MLHSVDLTNTNVKSFVTWYEWRKKLLQLRISPEFWLKNYMSFGVCRGAFEFAKSFRNEEGKEGEEEKEKTGAEAASAFHLMEFSLLKAYCLDLSFEAGLK